jgi:chorismate mutase
MLAALTRPEVEEKIVLRVREKVEKIQAAVRAQIRTPLAPEIVAEFYRDFIIPCTKEGELLYLENRSLGI